MTDNDIREYIEELEEPIFLKDVVGELTSKDPTISWKRVTRLMKEMGYENRLCKNALNPRGKGSAWFRTGNAVPTCGEDDYDDDDEVYDADEDDAYVDEVDEEGVSDAEKTEDTEETKAKTRSTADAVSDVEARNAANIEMNRRLLETLQISRNLKQEMMERQVDALVSMARMILAIHGTDDEKRRYFLQ